jgi:sulfite exporter TauE/SafE/copper chaperone CopZ
MKTNPETATINIAGMTCPGCENKIENALNKKSGVVQVKANYAMENAIITYDPSLVELQLLIDMVEAMNYKVRINKNVNNHIRNISITTFLFLAIVIIISLARNYYTFSIDDLSANTSYALLIVVGLFTSLHCVFMCGGINVSVCTNYILKSDEKYTRLKPNFLYNLGRIISYTVIGGILGAFSSIIELTPLVRDIVSIIAGSFMIIMAINLVGVFPALHKLTLTMPKIFGSSVYKKAGTCSPIIVGLLNGLMPCGALQSIQLYALGTGNFITGALSMFCFAIGTVPLMFGFGTISSLLNKNLTNLLAKIGAMIIMLMGVLIFIRGFSSIY